MTSLARAQPLTWSVPPARPSTSSPSVGVIAIEFNSSAPIRVTRLGYYDDTTSSAIGLDADHPVGLWDVTLQQMVATATIPAGTAAPNIGQFRMVAITPATLVPGRPYLLMAVDGGDPFAPTAIAGPSGLAIPHGIRVLRSVTVSGSTLGFPTPGTTSSVTQVRLGPVAEFEYPTPPGEGSVAWTGINHIASNFSNVRQSDGTEFSVDLPMDVTGVNVFDDRSSTPPGLSFEYPCGVFDVVTQQLLTSATVPVGVEADGGPLLVGDQRCIATPRIRLVPGRRYAAAYISSPEPARVFTSANMRPIAGVRLHAWRAGPAAGTGAVLAFPDVIASISTFRIGPSVMLAPRCRVDYNGSGAAEAQDIFDYLVLWFAGSTAADFNADLIQNTQDIFDFIAAWFGGC